MASEHITVSWDARGILMVGFPSDATPPLSLGSVWHNRNCLDVTIVGELDDKAFYPSLTWSVNNNAMVTYYQPSDLHSPTSCHGRF